MTGSRKTGSLAVAVIAVAAIASIAFGTARGATSASQLTVAGVFSGSAKDAGYNQAQYDGLMFLKSKVPGVHLLTAENIPESTVTPTFNNMVRAGAKLVFATSFGYQDSALNVAKANPSVVFEHAGGWKHAANFGTYWATASPIAYAAGVAAGKTTKSNTLGFVGAIPIPDVIGAVDAFQLGAQSVNPKVKTTVVFTGSWSDAAKEAAAVNTLANRGIDVIACEVDSPITVVKTAEQRHVFVVGYHSKDAAKYAPKYWLTGVDFNWGPMFVKLANDVSKGTYKATNWKPPVTMGIVRLAPFGPQVPVAAKTAATKVMNQFLSGERTSAFVGPVYDQSGKVRIPKGQAPPAGGTFEQNVSWLVQGIVGRTK